MGELGMKSLEAICAEYIGIYAHLYPDKVFEEQTFPVLHQIVKYLQADDLNRLESILLKHGIDVELAWKRLCSLRWSNLLGTLQPLSVDLFQQRIYPDFKTFYYSRQFLLNLSACVRNFKYGSTNHIPTNQLDVLTFHSQQEQWILRNIAAGRFLTVEDPSELQRDLLKTAAFCTTLTLQGSEFEYVNTNKELQQIFIEHLKNLTIQTISISSFPHIVTFLRSVINVGSLLHISLKNILVSEESLTELMCLICGAVGQSHTSAQSAVGLNLISSYKTDNDVTRDNSVSPSGSNNGDKNKRRKSMDVIPEASTSSTADSPKTSSLKNIQPGEGSEHKDNSSEGQSHSTSVRLQTSESERIRTETGADEFDLFDEAITMPRRPILAPLSLMSSAPCVCTDSSRSFRSFKCQCNLCNQFTKSICTQRMVCETKLEAFALNATHRLDVGHMLSQFLPGWKSLRKLALVSVMDVWSKAFECILVLLQQHQLTHLVLDMADIGIDGFGRLFQVLALAYTYGISGSSSAEFQPMQQLLLNMARPVELFELNITANLYAVVSLDLGSNTFSQTSFESVLHFISKDKALRILNFAYCGLTGGQVVSLLETLIIRGSDNVDELYLDDNNRDGVATTIDEVVCMLVLNMKTLKILSMSRCGLPGSLVTNTSFISAVVSHPVLHTLNLGNNRFGIFLLPFLEKIFTTENKLQKLNVGYNYLRGEDLRAFADRLLHADPNHKPTLQELDISGNNVGILSAFEWDSLRNKFEHFAMDVNATYIGIHHHFDDFIAQM